MRQITSSTLSNQSLATALNVATYTCDADRMLFVRCFVDQVAGNGSYSAYVTIQRLSAGSFYEVQPRTAPTVASGVTAIGFTTIAIPVKNTDVLKVYVLGLAGDTTTPDVITEIWEDDSLLPATAGNKLGVNATGQAGIDWGNVSNPTTTVALTGTTAGLIDGAITAAKIASDAITAPKIADGAIDAATFAAGAINAAAIAADAITDAKVASDVTIASVTGAVGSVAGNVGGSVASVVGNVGGNVTGSVGSVSSAVTVGTINANVVNASALAADAVAEIQSGLATATNVTSAQSAIQADIAAVQADTDDLQSRIGSNGAGLTALASATNLATANTNISAINTKLGTPAGATVSADVAAVKSDTGSIATSVAALPSASTIAMTILDTAIAEPTSVFSWSSATVRKILQWLAVLNRNKMTVTSTTQVVRNDADSATIATSTISDDNTTGVNGAWQ